VLGSSVEVTHESASLSAGHSFGDIYFDSFHRGEVYYDAGVAHSEPEPAVASSAYSQWQVLGQSKIESTRDIVGGCATHDHGRMAIKCQVEDSACRVILRSLGRDYMARDMGGQLPDGLRVERSTIFLIRVEETTRPAKCPQRRCVE
jgi:hypothetical protein